MVLLVVAQPQKLGHKHSSHRAATTLMRAADKTTTADCFQPFMVLYGTPESVDWRYQAFSQVCAFPSPKSVSTKCYGVSRQQSNMDAIPDR